jgi:hypothetical protein
MTSRPALKRRITSGGKAPPFTSRCQGRRQDQATSSQFCLEGLMHAEDKPKRNNTTLLPLSFERRLCLANQ